MERRVTLNRKEQKRLMVLNNVERGEIGGGACVMSRRSDANLSRTVIVGLKAALLAISFNGIWRKCQLKVVYQLVSSVFHA